LIVFGTWLGIPAGAPVPAWFPAASQSSALLLILPLITLVYVLAKTPSHRALNCLGGTYCYIRLGSFKLLPVALLMAMVAACPQYAHKLEFTWFGPAQAQLEIFAVSMILLGAIYEIIPRTMGVELPFKKWVGAQFFLSLLGIVIWVGALALAGAKQAHTNFDPAAPKFWLMMSSTGSVLLLLGSLVLLLNLGVMTFKWHIGVVKTVIATVTAPLPKEVKS
jgi:cytochrome c oxidase cbb3-type subunit 1